MVQMLCDVHLVDGTMLLYGPKDSLYKYGTNRYGVLFKKYGVDSATFNKSMKYYTARPDEIIAIYDRVTALLNEKSDSTGKVQAKIMAAEVKQLAAKGKKLNDNIAKQRKLNLLKRDSVKAAEKIKLRLKKRIN